MNKLLKRIEKLETLTERLEQAVREIRNSCPCLFTNQEPEQECPGSICSNCDWIDCICEHDEEESEETKDQEEKPKDHD